MFKKVLLSCFLFFCACGLLAQSVVSGKVIDENGESIPFVTVVKKGTTTGTTTDINGRYNINASPSDTIIFSFIGYRKVEIIPGTRAEIDILMEPHLATLDEVVVVGYGTTKKRDLTGSVSVLDPQELTKFPVSNIGSAMQGRLSGVQVINSYEPGANPQILVRGFGTIFGDANPLVVIDGLQTGVGALNNVDPSSVASIQVLKDASAAAIYGSRAANGVIIITTKKGQPETFQINVSSEIGIQRVANSFDLMNTTEYSEYTSRLYVNSSTPLVPRNPPAWTNNPDVLGTNTDWQDVIFEDAMVQNHNINFSGGGKDNTYYLGFGYLKQDGILPRTSFERYNLQINSQIKKNKFTIGESINIFTRFKPENDLTGNALRIYEAAPQIPMFDETNPNGFGAPFPEITGGNNIANPLAFQLRSQETRALGLLGNVFAEYEIFEGFSIRSDFNINILNTLFERFREPIFQSQAAISRNDYEILLRNSTSVGLNSETLLKYNKNFGRHAISAVAGYTVLSTINRGVTVSANNVEPGTKVPQTGQNQQATASYFEENLISQLARVNYSIDSKYLLTASIRRDGSSNFGENNRWGIFPSFSLGWQIGDEAFMEGFNWLSNLKIRGGYGELGRTLGSFIATLNSDIRYPWETGNISGVGPLTIPNDNLKWETVKQTNLGFDAALFDNKFNILFDIYQRRSDDMIIRSPLPQYTGIVQQPWINFGSMMNEGFEVEMSYNHVISNNADQRFKLNFTYNRNEVLQLNNVQDTLLEAGTLTTVGQPVAVHYGWLTNGINLQNGAMQFQDVNDNGIIDGKDRVVLGSPHPDFIYGFSYDLVYKNWDLTLFFQGVIGNQIMNEALQSLGSTHSDRNGLRSILSDSYDPELNPEGTIPIISLRDENNNDRISNRYIENGDYLRLRNIQIGYTMNPALLRNNVKKLRIYANVVNAFVITKYSGLDPDLNNNGTVFLLGRDTFRYPPLRSFNIGIQATL